MNQSSELKGFSFFKLVFIVHSVCVKEWEIGQSGRSAGSVVHDSTTEAHLTDTIPLSV